MLTDEVTREVFPRTSPRGLPCFLLGFGIAIMALCTKIWRMRKQVDIKEKAYNALSGVGSILIIAITLIGALYILTIVVRLLFGLAAA